MAAHAQGQRPISQRLAKVPGIGPIVPLTLSLSVIAAQFESGPRISPPGWV